MVLDYGSFTPKSVVPPFSFRVSSVVSGPRRASKSTVQKLLSLGCRVRDQVTSYLTRGEVRPRFSLDDCAVGSYRVDHPRNERGRQPGLLEFPGLSCHW